VIAYRHCTYTGRILIVEVFSWRYHSSPDYWYIPLAHGPVKSRWLHSLRRAPARSCRVDRARWKRRRFVQRLRRSKHG
jgi:hypothetical protein